MEKKSVFDTDWQNFPSTAVYPLHFWKKENFFRHNSCFFFFFSDRFRLFYVKPKGETVMTSQTLCPTNRNEPFPRELEQRFDRFLCALHFNPSLKGYPYLKHALLYEHNHRHQLPSLNKDIYDEIAKVYRTQIPAVERCIIFAIKKAYDSNPRSFRELFPDCKKAPSNLCFIKTASLHLTHPEE